MKYPCKDGVDRDADIELLNVLMGTDLSLGVSIRRLEHSRQEVKNQILALRERIGPIGLETMRDAT